MFLYFARCQVVQAVRIKTVDERRSSAAYTRWFYKIGVTSNLDRRLKELQTGCPLVIEWAGTLRCAHRAEAMDIEGDLHEHFRHRQTIGEWFTLKGYEQQALAILVEQWRVDDPIRFVRELGQQCREQSRALRLIRAAV